MCNQNSRTPNCASGEMTPTQRTAIKQVIDTNPEVASYYHQTKDQAFETWKRVYIPRTSPSRRSTPR